jgi:hypothetical protein
LTIPRPYSLLLPAPRSARPLEGSFHAGVLERDPPAEFDPALPPDAYRLTLDGKGVRLAAGGEGGARFARATLVQIRNLPTDPTGRLPAIEIGDAPALPRRGVMLDLSRCRVPTMDEISRTIAALAGLKADHLQFYTEHAFAYREHRAVWRGTDPITHDQARALDHRCRAHGVELAPNQNCFGHLTRWLRTPGYEHLAETHGDWIFAGMPRSGPFSLCPVEPGVLPFVESLLDELLPCFSSPHVNIGCDETYDIGQGRSRDAVEREGKAAVYGRFVGAVCRMALDRGKAPIFWGDIAREHPDAIDHLPREAVALVWGYEPAHDFAAEGAVYRERGMRWWACPGTSSWRSFAGRPGERRANIRRCAREAVLGGGEGLLVTDWGDLGHRQVWPVALLGIAEGLDAAWTGRDRGADFLEGVSLQVFGDRSRSIAGWLEELGDADEPIRAIAGRPGTDGRPTRLLNASALFTELHPPPLRLGLPDDPAPWRGARARIAALGEAVPTGAGPLVERELRHAVRCALFACDVALLRRGAGAEASALSAEREAIRTEQRTLWPERSRPGGLDESLAFWDEIDLSGVPRKDHA